jgi:fatty acid desaturase
MYQSRLDAAPFDPEDIHGLRSRIAAETLGEYLRFRKELAPDFAKVKGDIAGGYVALVAIIAGVWLGGLAAVPFGAILIGYTVAYLQLFIHEAAHFGLAADRDVNDRFANRLICWQVGTDIASYRETHWQHHRALGAPEDTEVSYRNRLSLRFLASMVTGFHAIRVFLSRETAGKPRGGRGLPRPLLIGVGAHLLILTVLTLFVSWTCALAWVGGMGVFFPFFATLRQLLEHRPMVSQEDRGAVTRIFGSGFFSSTFGAAGFNRHMLHHLEPQVHYTRLGDLEDYLMKTSACDEIGSRRTTYWRAFQALIASDRRG